MKKWKGNSFFPGLEIRGPALASPQAADPSPSLLPQSPGARCGAGGAGCGRAAQPPTPARPHPRCGRLLGPARPGSLPASPPGMCRVTPHSPLRPGRNGARLPPPPGRIGPWLPGTGTGAGSGKIPVCHGRTDKAGAFRRRRRSEGSRCGPSAPFSATRCVYAGTS